MKAIQQAARRLTVASVFGMSLAVGAALAADDETGTTEAPVIGANAASFTLDNGLEVVVIPDHRAPVVTHMVWYKVGSADEPVGKSGIAHFLEHLMFKGTITHPEGEFSRIVSENGGEENAFTSSDYTAYYQRVAREHLATMMSYEADRMAHLVLTDANVVPERQVVLEERSMRLDNEPSAILATAMDATLFLQHPYGVPIIGWKDEIETLDRTDAIAFYDRFYTPNNAVLVVAGDIEADEVRKLAEETYGKVARRAEPPARVRARAGVLDTPRQVDLADPRVSQESVRASWLVPSYLTAEPGAAEALDVLAEVLGGGISSRLYRELVIEQRLAVSAGAYYRGSALDATSFMAYGVPREGVSLETLRQAIFEIIAATAGDKPPTADEVARAKNRLLADTIYAQDSQTTMARIFGATLATGGTIADVQQWPSRIEAVPAEAVAAAAALLPAPRAVTGYLRKPAGEQPS
ncbi:M16 family metallopeptidase [Methylobrevis albus]|nr:pitrilysin family protein [Methylobrevis albus]